MGEKEQLLSVYYPTDGDSDCVLDPEMLVKHYQVPEQDLLGFTTSKLRDIASDVAEAEHLLG